jgi:alkylhydroperoxidase family enzyme
MTLIDPVEPSQAEEQGLRSRLESFAGLGDESAAFVRILAHAPGYAEALWDAMAEALFEGNVDHSLKEIIRIQLAVTAQDPYFSALRSKRAVAAGLTEERIAAGQGNYADDPQFSDAEKWALEYAYRMYRTPETVDAAFYDEGKTHWSEAQIMEVGGLVAIHYGMQVFMRTLSSFS